MSLGFLKSHIRALTQPVPTLPPALCTISKLDFQFPSYFCWESESPGDCELKASRFLSSLIESSRKTGRAIADLGPCPNPYAPSSQMMTLWAEAPWWAAYGLWGFFLQFHPKVQGTQALTFQQSDWTFLQEESCPTTHLQAATYPFELKVALLAL